MNGYDVAVEVINNKIGYLERCLDFYRSAADKEGQFWEIRIDRTLEAIYYLSEARKEIIRLQQETERMVS